MNRLIAGAIAVLALSGCATQYQRDRGSLTGGHYDQAGPGRLHMVAFSGNGFTPGALAEKFALFRCAEVAHSLDKPYFMMYDSLFSAARARPSSKPLVGTVINKPTAAAFILPLDAPAPGAHDTYATLRDLRNVVVTGQLEQPNSAKQ